MYDMCNPPRQHWGSFCCILLKSNVMDWYATTHLDTYFFIQNDTEHPTFAITLFIVLRFWIHMENDISSSSIILSNNKLYPGEMIVIHANILQSSFTVDFTRNGSALRTFDVSFVVRLNNCWASDWDDGVSYDTKRIWRHSNDGYWCS